MQEREQLERLRLDGQRLAVAEEPMPGEIDLDPLEVDDAGRRVDGDRLLRAAEQGPDPGRELAQAEGFRDVVVGTELEADHLVQLGVLGRQHDDRYAGFRPDDPAHLDARELRQHDVEKDQVRTIGPEAGERLAAVGRGDDPESLGLERVDQRLAERRLVFDDKNCSCHSAFRILSCVNGSFATLSSATFRSQPAGSGRFMKYSLNSTQRPSSSNRSR